jgi:copper(I)-binding protein
MKKSVDFTNCITDIISMTKTTKLNAVSLLVLSAAVAFAACSKKEEPKTLTINDPWILEVPAERPMTAAFMNIQGGSEGDVLLSAQSTVAKATEIHDMITENDIMKMRKIDKIEIPAGTEAVLKRGSKHIMLIDLIEPLKEGDKVKLTLTFEKAGVKEIEAPVRKAAIEGMNQMEHKHEH